MNAQLAHFGHWGQVLREAIKALKGYPHHVALVAFIGSSTLIGVTGSIYNQPWSFVPLLLTYLGYKAFLKTWRDDQDREERKELRQISDKAATRATRREKLKPRFPELPMDLNHRGSGRPGSPPEGQAFNPSDERR